MKVRLFFKVFIFSFSVHAMVLSPGDAADIALKNNISIKLSKAKSEEEKEKVLINASRLLPSLKISISQSRTFKENLRIHRFWFF